MLTRAFYAIMVVGFFVNLSTAQNTGLLQQIPEDKQNIIETISLYPADQRAAVLEASTHPEVLVRMDNIKANTESKFNEKINGIAEDDQKRIYNLARYPDLMNAISGHREERSTAEMKELLKNFPEEIHEDAEFVNNNYFDLLSDINQLYRSADQDFQRMLATYPEDIRNTYTTLSHLPEIVSLLAENLDLTLLLGDEYKKNPEQLISELDSLSVVVAEAKAKDLMGWKTELESNPEAMQEYEQSAKAFAGNEGYDDDVYEVPESETNVQEIYVHHDWNYYPYWFGYPAWYGYQCWYPYPWWYHWGFYYGPYHTMVIWGFPSDVFMYWQFYYPYNMYHYPHYANHVIHHYYGPRHIGSAIQPVYRQWEDQNKRQLPDNWFNDDANRVDRIREYGKFKMDYEKTVSNQTDKSPTEREYLKKNSNRYPTLKPVLTEKPEPTRTPSNQPQDYNPGQVKQPQPNPPRDIEPYKEKPTQHNQPAEHKPMQEKNPQRDAPPSHKEQPKAPPRDAPPPQKGKDQTQPAPTQPKKD